MTSSTLGETRRVSTLRGGSMTVLINSIKEKLLALPDQTVVYPGHGPIISMGNEKSSQPAPYQDVGDFRLSLLLTTTQSHN
jgi:glyoxylase-like metal-dependent hydrolase (beta-lactamase superfamily II)